MHVITNGLNIACLNKQKIACILEEMQLGFFPSSVCTYAKLESYLQNYLISIK